MSNQTLFNIADITIVNNINNVRTKKDNSNNGSIEINGIEIKIENGKLSIADIAHVYNVDRDELSKWISIHKKNLDKVFYKDMQIEKEEKAKIKKEKIEELDKDAEDYEEKKKEIVKKYAIKNVNAYSVADKTNKFIDPRVVLIAVSSIKPEFANWLTENILCNMASYKFDNALSIISFFNKVKSNEQILITELSNKCKTITKEEKTKQTTKSSKKVANKSMIVLIPSSKTQMPTIEFISTDKADKKEPKQGVYMDKVDIKNLNKAAEELEKIIIEVCELPKDEVEKPTMMKIRLTKQFTQELYENCKDDIIKAINKRLE